MGKRILLLSAYDAASHKRWREAMLRFLPEHDWTCLCLSPHHFSWRIRGNSLIWASSERRCLRAGYDLILATSMVDLAALKGMVPEIATTPAIVYFHENQFAYPESGRSTQRPEGRIVNLYSALAANRLLFNSHWNLDSFVDGAVAWIDKMPDHRPTNLRQELLDKSSVLPVPLEPELFEQAANADNGDRISMVWAHRWEWDKGPELLLEALKVLVQKAVPFKLNLVGQQFRAQPEAFANIRQLLEQHDPDAIGAWGFEPDISKYRALLRATDLVLSTADHDFQGLAVMEATAAGCLPVLPNRLAYPEFFEDKWLYAVQASMQKSAVNLVDLVESHFQNKCEGLSLAAPSLNHLSWNILANKYRTAINSL